MKTDRLRPPTARQMRILRGLVDSRGLPLTVLEQPQTIADAARIINRLLQGDLAQTYS